VVTESVVFCPCNALPPLKKKSPIGRISMMLYGSIHKTPKASLPYVAVITDEKGSVIASKPSASRKEADLHIQEAKLQLLRLRIAKRCKRRDH
jgi:hypothetical protein